MNSSAVYIHLHSPLASLSPVSIVQCLGTVLNIKLNNQKHFVLVKLVGSEEFPISQCCGTLATSSRNTCGV